MSQHIDRLALEAYAEKSLPPAQRRAVERHLETCPTCRAQLANTQQMSALLYRLPREEPAPDLAARINRTVAAKRPPASARWMRMLVLFMFALGLVLLALAAPQWSLWAQAAANAQVPTSQSMTDWLANLVAHPPATIDGLLAYVDQMLIGSVEEMGALITTAVILLASASAGGLAQLLSTEHLFIIRDTSAGVHLTHGQFNGV